MRRSGPDRICTAGGVLLVALTLFLAGGARADENGILGRFNRASWHFNHWLLEHVLDPVAQVYDRVVPSWGQTGVRNFLENLDRPRDAVNSLLQAKWTRAGRHLGGFMVDSTLGVAGLLRPSERIPLSDSPETLNETLGVYGLPPGFFLVLPLWGETCPRCIVGRLGDVILNPLWWIPGSPGTAATTGSRLLGAVNGLARQMPDPPASDAEWAAYERRILIWPEFEESRRLFFENLEFDVDD